MTAHADLFAALAAPFAPDLVSWRVGSTDRDKKRAMALAYIDARDVMERLDAVMGPAGWERRHPHVEKTTTCELTLIFPDGLRVTKTDGAGDTDVEAEKGSLSDSFKRAAVNWGVGRYLYDLDSPWVEIEPAGRSFKIKASEFDKLRRVLVNDARRTNRQPPAPPADEAPNAEETAITLLRGASADKSLFTEAWEKNKDGWKNLLSADAYARVWAEMRKLAKAISEREKADAQSDPFRDGGPGGVAGNNGDDQANPFAGAH